MSAIKTWWVSRHHQWYRPEYQRWNSLVMKLMLVVGICFILFGLVIKAFNIPTSPETFTGNVIQFIVILVLLTCVTCVGISFTLEKVDKHEKKLVNK